MKQTNSGLLGHYSKLQDASFVFKPSSELNISYCSTIVKNLNGKIVNFCKMVFKAENITGKLIFGSVILRPW